MDSFGTPGLVVVFTYQANGSKRARKSLSPLFLRGTLCVEDGLKLLGHLLGRLGA
jgi:hypothetical protein